MMARLKKLGIWKRAMVIVTADHGISFQGKSVYRRIAEPENLGGVANPPLFIKYPGQTKGGPRRSTPRRSTSSRRSPSSSGSRTSTRRRASRSARRASGGEVAVTNGQGDVIRMPLSRMLRQRNAVVKQAFFRLGSGDIYHLGPAPELIGTAAPPLSIGIRAGTSATVENGDALEDVDPRAQEIPAFVAGELKGVKPGAVIAIAVNGTVAATWRAFLEEGDSPTASSCPPARSPPGETRSASTRSARATACTPLGGN